MGCVRGGLARTVDVAIKTMTKEVPIPADCSVYASARTAYFADAFETLVPRSDLIATQLYGATHPAVASSMASIVVTPTAGR